MSTGILAATPGESDLTAILKAAETVAISWNENQAPIYGFSVFIEEAKVIEGCTYAAELFSHEVFPVQPGPFKRLAALLVAGRLWPFFSFQPMFLNSNGEWAEGCVIEEKDQNAWVVRMLVLMIPVVLSETQVTLNGKVHNLDQWNNFPSLHYRLEFMGWLRWLDVCDQHRAKLGEPDWKEFFSVRFIRMVMAASLMLEACYYMCSSSTPGHLQGDAAQCLKDLEEDLRLDLYYDHSRARD